MDGWMHTYIHTYKHTYIHTCMSSYKHNVFMNTTCMHACTRTYRKTCLFVHIYTHIRISHTSMATYVHTYRQIHVYLIQTYRKSAKLVSVWIQTYIRTIWIMLVCLICILANTCISCLPGYILTCRRSYAYRKPTWYRRKLMLVRKQTYIHMYVRTYIYTYIHTIVPKFLEYLYIPNFSIFSEFLYLQITIIV